LKNLQSIYFPVFVLLTSFCLKAQSDSYRAVETIRFRKDRSQIYFFQKGRPGDTIIKNQNDLFYLLVPDSLKPHIFIFVENGRLLTTGNDSLVRFYFLKGLNYESSYFHEEAETGKPGRPAQKKWVLKNAINGTAPAGQGNKIVIRIWNRREDKMLMENVFYYDDRGNKNLVK
jgi:hypothetical protein